jgi:hypothetical protein
MRRDLRPAVLADRCGAGHFQAVPLQRRIRTLPQMAVQPTVHAFRAEVSATPGRLPPAPGLGLGTDLQVSVPA